ncbi:MAG: hypothetical protein KatS3mg105_0864 [Gemmatales bacterium]|nr:MAG: hypothetical protein KatS3mg105_0864 [Gemmatales bacterium]
MSKQRKKSGALITARHAAEQGRVVFAIPGNIDSVASTGTNELIRRGAILARSADDIIEELEGVAANTTPKTESKPLPALDETEHRIWEFLAEPTHVDGIARALDTPVNELSATLMTMEMKKSHSPIAGQRVRTLLTAPLLNEYLLSRKRRIRSPAAHGQRVTSAVP